MSLNHEASFDEWEEEVPSDAQFNEEFKKHQLDLQRKEDELEKISQVISKKAELLKLENEEKQRLHNLKVQKRRLDVRLKLGNNWDRARRMFGLPIEKVQTMTGISFIYWIVTLIHNIHTIISIWRL